MSMSMSMSECRPRYFRRRRVVVDDIDGIFGVLVFCFFLLWPEPTPALTLGPFSFFGRRNNNNNNNSNNNNNHHHESEGAAERRPWVESRERRIVPFCIRFGWFGSQSRHFFLLTTASCLTGCGRSMFSMKKNVKKTRESILTSKVGWLLIEPSISFFFLLLGANVADPVTSTRTS